MTPPITISIRPMVNNSMSHCRPMEITCRGILSFFEILWISRASMGKASCCHLPSQTVRLQCATPAAALRSQGTKPSCGLVGNTRIQSLGKSFIIHFLIPYQAQEETRSDVISLSSTWLRVLCFTSRAQ